MLKFVKFQNVFAFFGVFYGLGWMQTALREMILETMFVCPVTYETRKTFDKGIVKFVSFGQQQQIYVMRTFV